MKFSVTILATALALLLTGCPRQPTRPTPQQTVIGPQSGGGDSRAGSGISRQTDLPAGLNMRGDTSAFDPNGQMRGAVESIYFEFDRSDIRADQRAKVEAAAKYLKDNPTYRFLLEGHCDWRGTAEYNLSLGDRRATAVKKFLETLGIASDRTEILSKGSLEAAKNADEATMAKDRRVEIVVVKR